MAHPLAYAALAHAHPQSPQLNEPLRTILTVGLLTALVLSVIALLAAFALRMTMSGGKFARCVLAVIAFLTGFRLRIITADPEFARRVDANILWSLTAVAVATGGTAIINYLSGLGLAI